MNAILGWDLDNENHAPIPTRKLGSGIRKQEALPPPEHLPFPSRWETEAQRAFANWWTPPPPPPPAAVEASATVSAAALRDQARRRQEQDEQEELDEEQRLAEEKEAQQRLRRAFLAKRKQERLKKKRKALKSNTHTKPFSKPSDSAVSEAFKKPPFHNCEYKEGFKICS